MTPALNNNTLFDTEFNVGGFTGVAGWSFSSAAGVGGAGNAMDFALDEIAGRLLWRVVFGDGAGWDSAEPITFFFVSTKGPTIGDTTSRAPTSAPHRASRRFPSRVRSCCSVLVS